MNFFVFKEIIVLEGMIHFSKKAQYSENSFTSRRFVLPSVFNTFNLREMVGLWGVHDGDKNEYIILFGKIDGEELTWEV